MTDTVRITVTGSDGSLMVDLKVPARDYAQEVEVAQEVERHIESLYITEDEED